MAKKQAGTWVYVGPVKAKAVFQIKAVLRGSKPPIWRRLLVRGDATLEELHYALQIAFEWTNSHLHDFRVGDKRYMVEPEDGFDPVFEEGVENSRGVRLETLNLKPRSRLLYTYDFGDTWEHGLEVERVLTGGEAEASISAVSGRRFTAATRTPVAACIDGARSGPVEDCGGVWGWADLCKIMADRKHPEHEERAEWIGQTAESFDPALFEVKPLNADLFKYLKR